MSDMNYTDARTMAYVNLYGFLGGLTALCDTVPEARKILGKSACSVGFDIKNGPAATLTFVGGRCIFKEGVENCAIRLPFSSFEKFNGMVDGTVKPVPTRGVTKLPFLLGKFKKLTALLRQYLHPSPEQMADDLFFRQSTVIRFRVTIAAAAQIANYDTVGKVSASRIADGTVKLELGDLTSAALTAKDHILTFSPKPPKTFLSCLRFADIKTVRALFDGRIGSAEAIGLGDIRVAGMIPQTDGVLRLLSRVGLYLK